MADFVLVHGACHGAWCWKKILPGLWSAGHRAFAVTLTGTGERAHQLSSAITLRTHTDDVAAVMEAKELRQAIVVGHSYGGMVITALADHAGAHCTSRVLGCRRAAARRMLGEYAYGADATSAPPSYCRNRFHPTV